MRVSEQWLREWVAYPGDTRALAHALTMSGLEVDAVEAAAPSLDGVVVGEIVASEAHPRADQLSVCTVAGGEGSAQVVCGAPNARPGLKAPFALPGAMLPDGRAIHTTTVRGVESAGMLCSPQELELAEDAKGLMALPADAPVGRPLRDYLALDDAIFELELTPNRGDCLGMAGVAREVGVLASTAVSPPDEAPVAATERTTLPVNLQAPAACPRYLGRYLHDVNTTAVPPIWLTERLRRAGIRPVSVVVDVTNYVMLELGQPMHGFDGGAIQQGIHVRMARAGETLTLLNGECVTLDETTLIIADAAKPLAMAGVMGGAGSAVSSATETIFLEAAHFTPAAMAGQARRYGLHSDSSHRFERGVDPELPRRAMERATALLAAFAGAKAGPVVEAVDAAHLPGRAEVALRPARLDALLGAALPRDQARDILQRLGMTVSGDDQAEAWDVTVPTWRFDITREVDLIEEVARLVGYDTLPSGRTPAPMAMGARRESELSEYRPRELLVDRGYYEAITYSFVPAGLQASLDPKQTPVALANPLSAELGVMRTSLWPGLVRALQHNRNRQALRVRLFETGLCFRGDDPAKTAQPSMLAGIATGAAMPEHWDAKHRSVDFFDVKADVEALIAATGAPSAFAFEAAGHPALHPGQSARIHRDGVPVGWLGTLHPAIGERLDIAARVVLFELHMQAVTNRAVPQAAEVSRFPAIRRDLAVVVADAVSARAVQACIVHAAGDLLRDAWVFDIYRGRGIDEGCKSLAIGLILQDSYRTLTEDRIESCIEAVVRALRQEVNASLRE